MLEEKGSLKKSKAEVRGERAVYGHVQSGLGVLLALQGWRVGVLGAVAGAFAG